MEESVKEIAECCICIDLFTDPRMLPCIHTFCLKCLNETSDKAQLKPGDFMPCPLCRTNFIIPKEGMVGLKKNFFIERLVEIAKISKPSLSATLCQVCIENGANDPETATATQYCIQCQQHICNICSQDHRKFKGLRDHQIIPLDNPLKEGLMRKLAVEYCDQHNKKETEMYCFNCKKVICMMCFAEEHQSHKCLGLEKAVGGFREEIAIDLKQMEFFSKEASDKISEIENHRKKFRNELENTEKLINKRGEQLKERVDECLHLLLHELNSVRLKGEKQLEIEKEEIDRHQIAVESLVLYYKELITKGSSTEISRGMDELRCRIQDIKDNHGRHIQHQIQPTEIVSVSSKIEQFLEGGTIVGSIEDVGLKHLRTRSVDDIENPEHSTALSTNYIESLLSDKKYIDQMQPYIIDIMKRLNNLHDFSSKKCLDAVNCLLTTYDGQRKSRSRKVGDILATSGIAELFQRIFEKHFENEFTNNDETPMKNLMILILNVLWNFTDKSKMLCVRIFKGNLMNNIVGYLDSNYLDPMKTRDSVSFTFIIGLLAILHNTLSKVTESSQVLRKKRAVHVFQRFRNSPDKDVALIALILQGHLVGDDEIELLNSTDNNFHYMKEILEYALNRDNVWRKHNGYSAIEVVSALNSLAINDGNKMIIVNIGLLPIYVKLLQKECSVEEQAAAAEGLLILSTTFLNEVENEPGCLAALQNLTFCKSERVRLLAEEVLLNFEGSKMRL